MLMIYLSRPLSDYYIKTSHNTYDSIPFKQN